MTVNLTALDAATKALLADPKAAASVKKYATANTAALHAMQPPAPGAGLASMFGGYGYSWQQSQAQVASRETAGASYRAMQWHMGGDLTQMWPADQFGPTVKGCASPLTTYSPTQAAFCAAHHADYVLAWTPSYSIPDFNAGLADAVLRKMVAYLASLAPQTVLWRPFAEFDLPSAYGITKWDATGKLALIVPPTQFVKAWQRVAALLPANVRLVWCPTEGDFDRATIEACYPGGGTIVGSDQYNTAQWATPLHDGWATFEEMFHYDALGNANRSKYTFSVSVGAPFMVCETSCLFDPAHPTRKAEWFEAIPAAVAKMPGTRFVSFYDADVSATGDYDWRVDSNASVQGKAGTSDPATLAGFVAMSAAL